MPITERGMKLVQKGDGEMTLADFIKYLVTLLNLKKIDMPYEDERSWHELFFFLKTQREDMPDFIRSLIFDWDTSYPKSSEVSEYLHALHWTACVTAQNPSYEKITLSPQMSSFWQKEYDNLDAYDKNYLTIVVPIAERFMNN